MGEKKGGREGRGRDRQGEKGEKEEREPTEISNPFNIYLSRRSSWREGGEKDGGERGHSKQEGGKGGPCWSDITPL